MATTPFRIELPGCHHLVGDELPGDGPAYVFLHGLGSTRAGEKSESLLRHARARGRGFIRFDMRGHGDSSGALGRVTVTELVEDAVRVLERTGRAVVVGSSLGGLVAAHAAAARPDLIERLALLAPALGLMPRIREQLDEDSVLHMPGGHSFFVEQRVCDNAEALDERSLPREIRAPTLVVHGDADEVIPQQVSAQLFAALGSEAKQLWIVDGGDHRLSDVADDIWRRVDALTESEPT